MFTLRFIIAYRIVHVSGKYPAYEDVRLFSLETISNTGPMVKLGLKALCMQVWIFWIYDIFGFMALTLGAQRLAACAVMRNIGYVLQSIPVGSGFTCAIYTANYVGSGHVGIAK